MSNSRYHSNFFFATGFFHCYRSRNALIRLSFCGLRVIVFLSPKPKRKRKLP